MSDTAMLEREVQSLRDRLFRLAAPSRRINESLDFGTVLQGVLDNARALTNARYGGISLVDVAGQMRAVEPSQNSAARCRKDNPALMAPEEAPSPMVWQSRWPGRFRRRGWTPELPAGTRCRWSGS